MHSEIRVGLHVKHLLLLSSFNQTGTCEQILLKFPNIKLHENLLSGSNVVTCRQTGMAKLTAAFLQHSVATTPVNQPFHYTRK
jgi:hypothetical protein